MIAAGAVGTTDDPVGRVLTVYWPDGFRSNYHYVWLRHCARCFGGMPNDTAIKIDLVPDDPASLSIQSCASDGNKLRIQWSDSLGTEYSLEHLRSVAYDAQARAARKPLITHWDAASAAAIPRFDHADLSTDERLLDLQLAVSEFGIALVRGVPTQPGSVASFAEHFGPIHVNNYGGVFDVRSDHSKNLGSNTGAYLGPHTDESYRHAPPGISTFHCLEFDCEGGDSILVDGFRAAQQLRETDSDAFATLCSVPVFFQRKAPPLEDMQTHGKVIVLDDDGDLAGIKFTDRTLPPQDAPPDKIEDLYRAIRAYWRLVNDRHLQLRYRMQPGDLHIFDNHRVLHGRTAFDPATGGRHLQQCSVNRDEFHNTLRLRAAQFRPELSTLTYAHGALG